VDEPAGLVESLDARSWSTSPRVHVMVAEIGHALRAATGRTDLELRTDDGPDDSWLACYRQDGGSLPPAARLVLTNHPSAGFTSYRENGRAVAIARAAVDHKWAGLFAVEVAPDFRRRGLGALVSAAALRWAAERGARRSYLQVTAENSAAIGLYERLGFATHHDYVYRYPEAAPNDFTNC
jgi:ribosomal protein S18 acetylase RimI-like enzyme